MPTRKPAMTEHQYAASCWLKCQQWAETDDAPKTREEAVSLVEAGLQELGFRPEKVQKAIDSSVPPDSTTFRAKRSRGDAIIGNSIARSHASETEEEEDSAEIVSSNLLLVCWDLTKNGARLFDYDITVNLMSGLLQQAARFITLCTRATVKIKDANNRIVKTTVPTQFKHEGRYQAASELSLEDWKNLVNTEIGQLSFRINRWTKMGMDQNIAIHALEDLVAELRRTTGKRKNLVVAT